MYQEHFGLKQEPFSIAPDPSFLFLSESHNEALAHLLYGFSHGGFVLISGEVGTGKTTLLRNLLNRTPAEVDVAFILNPRLTVKELLETLCEELGVISATHKPESVKQYIDLLNKHLLRTHQSGRSTVVVIDEAQNLTPAVLEQIRLLTNLETNEKKLLRIILLGQPELVEMLDKTELRQLSQRITARYHLAPLSKSDTTKYVTHRLARAGGNPEIFTKPAISRLYRLSGGIPRLINIIADRAMLGAYVNGEHKVSQGLVRGAAKEVFGRKGFVLPTWMWTGALGALLALMLWAGISKYGGGLLEQVDVFPADSPTTVGVLPEPRQQIAEFATTSPPMSLPTEVADSVDTIAIITVPDTAQKPVQPVIITRPDTRSFLLQRQAYADVFELWGAVYAADSDLIPCDFAPQVGLQCLRRNGGWGEVSKLNMPVVLELWDDAATPYYGAIIDSNEGRFKLQVGEQSLWVAPRDLRDAWFGSYVLLWQTPPSYQGSVREGDEHASVLWVRSTLANWSGAQDSDASSTFFDTQLQEKVLAFQHDEGLLGDGVVGPLTWINLNRYVDNNGPKLSR
ncbi:MAG: general secretion pathway protein A [Candidatus Azotimanducaceae bacterium]|jgi:general secretion pathway protein A